MQRSTYRKKIPPQRKIIVYYEKDEDETEIIPSNNKKSEFTKKCDENMSETCEEIQCSKEKTAVKSF